MCSASFYVAGMSVVSLVTSASSLLSAASNLVGGSWRPQTIATGLVWASVWLWHRRMAAHKERGPRSLSSVAPTLSAVYGLILGTGGAVTALGVLLDTAIRDFATEGSIGRVILVAAVDAEAQELAIEKHTGAPVTVWLRDDKAAVASAVPRLDLLTDALDRVRGKRVIVVTGPAAAIDVIPLLD